MKIFILKRTHKRKDGVFGVVDEDGEPFAVTGELPWKNNAIGISCIPHGEYPCRKYNSPKFGWIWQVCDVRGRSMIEIHWGNIPLKDSEGCIIVGENFHSFKINGREGDFVGVGNSRTSKNGGYNEFWNRTKDLEEFKLIIEDCIAWTS